MMFATDVALTGHTAGVVDVATGQTDPRRPVHRPGHRPRRWVPSLTASLVMGGLAGVVILGIASYSRRAFSAPGGVATFLGQEAGLAGGYLLLVMVLLMGRIPAVERAVGQDRLAWWHRELGPWPIFLLLGHAVLITVGYAAQARTGALHELRLLLLSYPDVMMAVVALGLIVLAGITSMRWARAHMRYETWWSVHLYLYLALSLSFAHQIANGQSFVGHPLAIVVWSVLWAGTAGTVLAFRVLLPIWRSVRHHLHVVGVNEEAPGVVSIVCAGRHLDRLAVSGGQFFRWRFMTKGLWWQAHPYSLSALPRPPYMRVTVKGLGDQSGAVARIKPGTRVWIEGPYGAFTHHARRTDKVLLVGAGVGVTPLRAILEDLPRHVDVTVVLRWSTAEQAVLAEEMQALVSARHGRMVSITGSRHEVVVDGQTLVGTVPDVAERDVYVCGPEGWAGAVVDAAGRAGVPAARIHREVFAF
ncbi:MAG TPA: ferredoxin reductase family protein [Acidimicrobiales bacterium]|nr:ferredoxin reductase family protein [Acidimicrobiales bacterium]